MKIDERGYRSFLLRLWFMKHDGGHIWRASLEHPRSGLQQSFSNLDDLIQFLRDLCVVLEGEVEESK